MVIVISWYLKELIVIYAKSTCHWGNHHDFINVMIAASLRTWEKNKKKRIRESLFLVKRRRRECSQGQQLIIYTFIIVISIYRFIIIIIISIYRFIIIIVISIYRFIIIIIIIIIIIYRFIIIIIIIIIIIYRFIIIIIIIIISIYRFITWVRKFSN